MIVIISPVVAMALAMGAIGGLATEAIVALFFMPCLYALVARRAAAGD